MSGLDHLIPFIDNGGRRSNIERRRNSKLTRIPQRRTHKERRIIFDRRKTHYIRGLMAKERRMKSV